MTSELQHRNQVEVLSLYNSEIHEYSHFKFLGIIVFLSNSQNKLIKLDSAMIHQFFMIFRLV